MILHAFITSSLPASCWLCPIIPGTLPWQSSPLNSLTFQPSPVHHKPHQELWTRWYPVLPCIPLLSGTDIACRHLHRWTHRQFFESRCCYRREKQLPLFVRRVGAASARMRRQACFSRQEFYNRQLWLLRFIITCTSVRGKGEKSTQHCCVRRGADTFSHVQISICCAFHWDSCVGRIMVIQKWDLNRSIKTILSDCMIIIRLFHKALTKYVVLLQTVKCSRFHSTFK